MYPLLMAAAMTCACVDDGSEAGADAAIEEADAAPLVVYLVFDGLSLTTGSSDAPARNVSQNLPAPFTAPPFFADESNRVEKLALIADGARTILAAYNIEVVTERPATGDYEMIVLGGQSEDARLTARQTRRHTLRVQCGLRAPKEHLIYLREGYASNEDLHSRPQSILLRLALLLVRKRSKAWGSRPHFLWNFLRRQRSSHGSPRHLEGDSDLPNCLSGLPHSRRFGDEPLTHPLRAPPTPAFCFNTLASSRDSLILGSEFHLAGPTHHGYHCVSRTIVITRIKES